MKTFSILTVCFLLCSCAGNKPSQEFFTADVQSINHDQECHLDEVFSNIEYVPLEHTEESQVGDIRRILKAKDNSLIVWDTQTNSAFRFDAKGKFLNKIGATGHAKNEYNLIGNIAYNPYTDQVWVIDMVTAIVIYQPDGTFVRRIDREEGMTNIGFVDANHYCLYGAFLSNEHFYAIYNIEDNKEVFKFCPRKGTDVLMETGGAPNFRYYNGQLIAHTKYSDMAYVVDTTSIQPICQVNYLGSEKFMKGFNPEEILEQGKKEGYMLSCYDVALTDKYLFSEITIPEKPMYKFLLSVNVLKSGQQYYLPTSNGDEAHKFCPCATRMQYVDNQQFIAPCEEEAFTAACSHLAEKQDTLCAEYAQYKQLAQHQNPVLMVAKLK